MVTLISVEPVDSSPDIHFAAQSIPLETLLTAFLATFSSGALDSLAGCC